MSDETMLTDDAVNVYALAHSTTFDDVEFDDAGLQHVARWLAEHDAKVWDEANRAASEWWHRGRISEPYPRNPHRKGGEDR